MKVAHLCLANYYSDGYGYQENELVKSHVKAGHDVVVVASTEKYIDNLNVGIVSPGRYYGSEGALVIRVPYLPLIPLSLARKIRAHQRVYEILKEIEPDVIVFHGLAGWDLRAARKYCEEYPGVVFYADCHADFNNSAKSFVSKNILHKLYYKWIIKSCLHKIKKVLCISLESLDFCKKVYGLNEERLEFYPLGGRLVGDEEYHLTRQRVRNRLGVSDSETIFLQSGKFSAPKRVQDSLAAFAATRREDFKYFLVGSVPDSERPSFEGGLFNDARVSYLGWKSSDELYDLLCAADVYVQIGSQSATMQASLCARCAVILADVPSHVPFMNNNGWLVTTVDSVVQAFKEIEQDPARVTDMGRRSFEVARRLLDYDVLSERLLR